jgi:hypothetical protein
MTNRNERMPRYADSQDRAQDLDLPYFVMRSDRTGLWYVRETLTGEVLLDRETKRGAYIAMRRLEVQHAS